MSSTQSDILSQRYGLSGKTALVTGGGTGIGYAISKCLSLSGAKVIIAGRREEILAEAQKTLPGDIHTQILDVSDVESLQTQENTLYEKHGVVDMLVNNAGNTLKKPFLDSDMAEFDQVFDVHVRGALEFSRAVMKRQAEASGGSVLFTSSMTAFIGQPNVHGYTIAKTAISGVVRALSAEMASKGIRVNGVAPGWIDTDLYRKATHGDIPRQQKILSRIPMGRLGTTEEIGWVCAFLASEAASYINGQIILADGGGATGF